MAILRFSNLLLPTPFSSQLPQTCLSWPSLNRVRENFTEPLRSLYTSEDGFGSSLFVDYIHMTNNRLGIFNRDESYLSFMMMRCLEEIKKDKRVGVEV